MSHESTSTRELRPRGELSAGRALLSVVVPVFNESEVLPAFHARLSAVLDGLPLAAEIL